MVFLLPVVGCPDVGDCQALAVTMSNLQFGLESTDSPCGHVQVSLGAQGSAPGNPRGSGVVGGASRDTGLAQGSFPGAGLSVSSAASPSWL